MKRQHSHRRRSLLIRLALFANLALLFMANCREPTSILIEAQTNVVYRQGIVTSFTVGKPGTTEDAAPTTEAIAPWGADGVIGSLVVVPETSDEASVSIKLVMGVGGRDPRACSGTDPVGCIIARRRLRYIPHQQLRLPIALYARCEGIPCDAVSTCNYLGQCVNSEIDPTTCATASGCHPTGDPPRISSDPDAGNIITEGGAAASDSSDDRSISAPPTDAADDGSDAGGKKDGSPSTPGLIDCRSTQCTFPLQQCCYDPLTQTGACLPYQSTCPVNSVTVRCDGTEDCPVQGQSCCAVSSNFVVCEPTTSCLNIICHSDDTCPLTNPPSACTGKAHLYYSSCVR